MRVLVLGAGVIGVSTAHYLARQGMEVTVLERRAGPALETSHANAGQVSPGYSTPWAAPGIPLKALRWMFERHAPLSIRPDGSLFQWQWLARMWRECGEARYAINKERMLRLAEYSRDALRALRAETGIAYEERTRGTLQVFRTAKQLDGAARDVRLLQAHGVPYELLDAAGLAGVEPALAGNGLTLAGGLRLPNDETGDCHIYTTRLAQHAAAHGVRFRYDTSVDALRVDRGRVAGVRIGRESLAADRVVVALASHSRALLRPHGIDLPVYPVKGYSLTLDIHDEAAAPHSTVLDETYKIAVTRFERRIRVGGMAELAGYDDTLRPARLRTLQMVLESLFPGAADLSRTRFWTGLRPMTPDSTPIVGASPVQGLWLNTGHGTLGWTMAAGSGRLLADLIAGRTPEIDPTGLAFDRYARGRAGPPGVRTGEAVEARPALD